MPADRRSATPNRRRERQLLDVTWGRARRLLPAYRPPFRFGRPFADDKACLAGIVYQLRNGVRWNTRPLGCPPGGDVQAVPNWTAAVVWPVVLTELAAAGLLNMSEMFWGAMFAEALRGRWVGRTRCSVGMKVERATDPNGVPVGVASDAANVPEAVPAGPPWRASRRPARYRRGCRWWPIADRGYESDPLREQLAGDGFVLVAPHRRNPTRLRTADGRRHEPLWKGEPSLAWMKAFRRVAARYEVRCHLYDGFVALAYAFIARARL